MINTSIQDIQTEKSKNRLAYILAGLVFMMITLASCAGGHSNLGTASSTCFLALPQASQAVQGHGTLVGVKSFNPAKLTKELQARASRLAQIGSSGTSAPAPLAQIGSSGTSAPNHSRELAAAHFITRELARFGHRDVCAIEYKGNYLPQSVSNAVDPNASGKYALIVLPEKGGQPVISMVLKKLPLAMRHFF